MPQTDGSINRRGPEYQVSEFPFGIGNAPCDACHNFHTPTQTSCGDYREPIRQYLLGPYGSITRNPVWIRNQQANRYTA